MSESNKLIAEFMGSKTIRINVPFEYDLGEELPTSKNTCNSIIDAMEEVQTEVDEGIINGCDLCMEVAEYHNSWDLLIPVVEKIEDMGCEVVMTNGACTISAIGYHARSFGKSRRDATYNAVIEFIKQNEDE